jgi:hypothetical protein
MCSKSPSTDAELIRPTKLQSLTKLLSPLRRAVCLCGNVGLRGLHIQRDTGLIILGIHHPASAANLLAVLFAKYDIVMHEIHERLLPSNVSMQRRRIGKIGIPAVSRKIARSGWGADNASHSHPPFGKGGGASTVLVRRALRPLPRHCRRPGRARRYHASPYGAASRR